MKTEDLRTRTSDVINNVVRHYEDSLQDENTMKLIEHGVAKSIAEWAPYSYNVIDISAWQLQSNPQRCKVTVTYKSDEFDTILVWGEYPPIAFNDIISKNVQLGVSPRGNGSDPVERVQRFYDKHGQPSEWQMADIPTSEWRVEDFVDDFSQSGPGSKVETLPEVDLDELTLDLMDEIQLGMHQDVIGDGQMELQLEDLEIDLDEIEDILNQDGIEASKPLFDED